MADYILRLIVLYESWYTQIQISHKSLPKASSNGDSALTHTGQQTIIWTNDDLI